MTRLRLQHRDRTAADFPVSPVLSRQASAEELEALASAAARASNIPPLPRSTAHAGLRDEWARFLGRFPLDTFFTLTFCDRYAAAHCVYSNTSALNNFERWVDDTGFPGQYFVAAEPHFDRDVPHLHGLLESRGLPLPNLWASWFAERGRGRLEPPRTDAAAYYCTKYLLKEANADTVRFRLSCNPSFESRHSKRQKGDAA